MANTLGIDYAEDAGEMMADSGQTCTIAGTSEAVSCIAGAESRLYQVEADSDVVAYQRKIIVKIADLDTTPAMRTLVVIDSVRYVIDDMTRDVSDGIMRLTILRNQDN